MATSLEGLEILRNEAHAVGNPGIFYLVEIRFDEVIDPAQNLSAGISNPCSIAVTYFTVLHQC